MTKERIGFIGVGLMGEGMAKNILAKGYALTVMGNRNRAPVERLLALGASEAKTPAEVAKASDIVFLCVTDSPTVEGIVRGQNGIKAGAAKGMVLVDCSTANPVSTHEIATELAAIGVGFADAPLGGTPVQADAGQLSAMVGADDATFQRIRPVIEAWAARVVHLGPVGTGHKMKLLNNFLSMGYAAIYAEALAIGRKNGISVETFDSVLRGSRMDCGFYQTFMGYALEGNPESHKFTLSNAYKDLRYVDAMAAAAQMANPVSATAKNLFGAAVGAGMGSNFVPALSDYIARQNGLKGRFD